MKYLVVMAALAATPVMADAPEVSLSFSKGAFSGSIAYDEGDISEVKAGVTYFEKSLSENLSSRFYTGASYDFELERTKIVNDFRLNYRVTNKFGAYGIANVDYIFDDENSLIVGPTFGAYYAPADNISVYADITATYDALDSFKYLGAEVGGGVSYGMTEKTWVTVGFTRAVDVEWEAENEFYVNTSFAF